MASQQISVIVSSCLVSTPSASKSKVILLVAAITAALAVILLLGFVPYSLGYGEIQLTLAETTFDFWQLDEWQHCWLVIPICAFLVWRKRETLRDLPLNGAFSGIIAIALGLAFYWAGYRTGNYFIGIVSVVIVLGGIVLWFGGWRWVLALVFPLAFLFFALPLLFLESMLAFRLRLIMSDASVILLNGIGIHTVQQGTAILSAPDQLLGLPRGAGFSVDVADPCSGIRSLFALTMVTALYAYFAIKPIWKQFALFACAVPLAVLGNMARIMMLTLGTIAVGPEIAIGSLEHPSLFHQIAGYLVFIVALAGMIGIGHLLMMDWRSTLTAAREKIRAAFTQTEPALRPARSPAPSSTSFEDEY